MNRPPWISRAGLVGDALTGIGEALVGLSRPAEALPHLERALVVLSHYSDPVNEVARARLALARALWDAPAGVGRDRKRARELVLAARADCETAGKRGAKTLAKADTWLATHGE